MLDSLYLRLADLSPAALIIIPLAIMFFCAFGMTRITKRLRLPSVTAYLTAGILIGPCCLNLIPQPMIEKTDFLADLALCFIAFSAGEFFKLETLRKNGWKVVWVTIAEACAASLVVFGVTRFLLGLSLPFCVVLAALASATAPASTMMTIRQTGAQGELVDTLLQVVALDDVVSLLAYSAAIAFALHSLTGRSSDPMGDLLVPIGTPISDLIREAGSWKGEPVRLVAGGPMTGRAQHDLTAPVTGDTRALLALSAADLYPSVRPESPCLRCGRCVEACPAGLAPLFLHLYVRKGQWEALEREHISACSECGACAYVCPAHLRLVHSIRVGKRRLSETADGREADHEEKA